MTEEKAIQIRKTLGGGLVSDSGTVYAKANPDGSVTLTKNGQDLIRNLGSNMDILRKIRDETEENETEQTHKAVERAFDKLEQKSQRTYRIKGLNPSKRYSITIER